MAQRKTLEEFGKEAFSAEFLEAAAKAYDAVCKEKEKENDCNNRKDDSD